MHRARGKKAAAIEAEQKEAAAQKLRCRMRNAIPEALPERVTDAAIDAVTQETDKQQPVQDASKQRHGQERH